MSCVGSSEASEPGRRASKLAFSALIGEAGKIPPRFEARFCDMIAAILEGVASRGLIEELNSVEQISICQQSSNLRY